jgi:hypothetical protein
VGIEKTYKEILADNRLFAANAVGKMGGPAKAAKRLTELLAERGENKLISVGQVWAWLNRDKRGIPLEYLIDIENESGIPREKMRGDVPWRNRDNIAS